MSRNVSFIVFFIVAGLAAANAGQMAALLHATGTVIVAWGALTFMSVLGMCMTAYVFLRQPPAAPQQGGSAQT